MSRTARVARLATWAAMLFVSAFLSQPSAFAADGPGRKSDPGSRIPRPGTHLLVGVQAGAEVFREDFNDNHIDSALWTPSVYGTGPQIAEVNQELEIAIPGWSHGGDFGAKLQTNFRLRGDFDVQVDFRLLAWPYGNGVRTALGIDEGGPWWYPPGVERLSFGANDYPGYPRESYLTDFGGVCGITGTGDMTGTLRLVRTGGVQSGYRRSGGVWVLLCTGSAPPDDVQLRVSAFTAYQFQGWDVLMAFDNFVVNSGELVDFPTPTQSATWGSIKALYR
jgi:hypothetical protein